VATEVPHVLAYPSNTHGKVVTYAMNIGAAIKSEISRLARKELKAETEVLKRSSAKYRSDIAELKRQIADLQRQVKVLSRANGGERRARAGGDEEAPARLRFSAKALAAQRQRLGLSAEKFGKLVGVSGQTVYLWEAEKTRPRNEQLQAIAAVRKMGKRAAVAALEAQE